MESGVVNPLDNFIFDPTEISLEDYLNEWKLKAQTSNISDAKLGYKLLKCLDFPKKKVEFILEKLNVDECIKQGKFVSQLITVITRLSTEGWKSSEKKLTTRFEITEDENRTKNVLEDCEMDHLKDILEYLSFPDKKNMCLLSKRMYQRMMDSEPDLKKWKIKLTETNYRYYLSNLKSSPYAEAQKDIELDMTQYQGSAKRLAHLVKDRVTSIIGLDVNIINGFLNTDSTLENIKSLSFHGIKSDDTHTQSMIAFLDCAEIAPKELKFITCEIDRQVMDLGFETFDCVEELVIQEDKMKSTSLRILLRKSSKTLKSLEIIEPKFKKFNVLVLQGLKFPNLLEITLDLRDSPVSCYTLMECLSKSSKSLESLTLFYLKEGHGKERLPVINFPALKHFWVKFDEGRADGSFRFPYSTPVLTKLVIKGLVILTSVLHEILAAVSHHLEELELVTLIIFEDKKTRLSYRFRCLKSFKMAAIGQANPTKDICLNMFPIVKQCEDTVQFLSLDVTFNPTVLRLDRKLYPEVNNLTELVWKGVAAPLLGYILERCAHSLQYLVFAGTDLDKIKLVKNFSKLKVLSVQDTGTNKREDGHISLLNKCSETIECFTALKFPKMNMIHSKENADSFPKLKEIVFKDCNEILNLAKFCNTAAQQVDTLQLIISWADDLHKLKLPLLKSLQIRHEKIGDLTHALSFSSNSLQFVALTSEDMVPVRFRDGFSFAKLVHLVLQCDNSEMGWHVESFLPHCAKSLKFLALLNNFDCVLNHVPWDRLNLSDLHMYNQLSDREFSLLCTKVSSDCKIEIRQDTTKPFRQHFRYYEYLKKISEFR